MKKNIHRQYQARKKRGLTFGIAPKVTKGLGPKPPKAEKPGSTPKIRKLAVLKQYEFLNGIPPGFSPAERFFRQRARGYGSYGVIVDSVRPPKKGVNGFEYRISDVLNTKGPR